MRNPLSKFQMNLLNAIALIGIGLYYLFNANEELWGFSVPREAGGLFIVMGILWLYFLLVKKKD
jgi:hypothetical protein